MAVSGLVLRDSLSEEGTFEMQWLGKTMLAAGEGAGSPGRRAQLPTQEIRNLVYIILPTLGPRKPLGTLGENQAQVQDFTEPCPSRIIWLL